MTTIELSAIRPAVEHLMTDEEVLYFIARGYHLIRNPFSADFNAEIHKQCLALTDNPGDAILERIPLLYDVFAHPKVRGPLVSLCGADVTMNDHRHCHVRVPTPHAHNWHTDSQDRGTTDLRWVLAMYYPHDVTADMGPTVVLPGSQFRSAPNPTLESFANIRGQRAMAVQAGTVAIVHPNIWHGAGPNFTDCSRFMLKFLFDRVNPNSSPNWQHDPQHAELAAKRILSTPVTPIDRYDRDKEKVKRMALWRYLCGR